MDLVLTLAGVAVSMSLRDLLGTKLVQAIAARKGWLAGILDGLGDVAAVLCTIYGAGEVVLHGWNGRGILILAVMAATSCATTKVAVDAGKPHPNQRHHGLRRFLP
jgi:hypothetical protein